MDDLNKKHHCPKLALNFQIKQGGYNNEWMNIFIKNILFININYKSQHEKTSIRKNHHALKVEQMKKNKKPTKKANMKWQRKNILTWHYDNEHCVYVN
jgi:hypothetical protein